MENSETSNNYKLRNESQHEPQHEAEHELQHELMHQKARLRALAKARRKASVTAVEDQKIQDHLLSFLLAAPQSATVISYLSLPDEFPTLELLDQVATRRPDINLYAPRVESTLRQGARMEAYPLPRSDSGSKILWSDLQTNSVGLLEPRAGKAYPADEVLLSETEDFYMTYLIVPALLIDSEGHRLGYGGGYYDRYIARLGGHALLLAPRRKIMAAPEALPRTSHDHPIDVLVNASGPVLTHPLEGSLTAEQKALFSK